MHDELSTLADVRTALASGASSAQDIVKLTLARIERHNGQLHAFVAVPAERALADAHHIDALRKIGVRLGPLAGAPIGIKDLIDVADLPTRAGSLTRAAAPPATRDAPAVERLRAAGAIIVGKTHTVEYAFGGWGTNETVGTPRNPRDMNEPRVPGGSSSGSGVAVAAGPLRGGARLRHRRLGSPARLVLRRGRPQDDVRPRRQGRGHAARAHARLPRTVDQQRRRRRCVARRSRAGAGRTPPRAGRSGSTRWPMARPAESPDGASR